MKDTLTVLKEARKLIEDPDRWGKSRFGGDNGPWCAEGACFMSAPETVAIGAIYVLDAAAESWGCAMAFNDADSTTHADILALFDRAIAAEEAKLVKDGGKSGSGSVQKSPVASIPQIVPRRRDDVGCETRVVSSSGLEA